MSIGEDAVVSVPVKDGTGAAMRIFARWGAKPHTFWLDSAGGPERLSRFSFLGTDPYTVVRAGAGGWRALEKAAAPVARADLPPSYPAPFGGGLVGYIAYEAAKWGAEPGERPSPDGAEASHGTAGRGGGPDARPEDGIGPKLLFGAYDAVVCVDHRENKLYLVSTGLPERGAKARAKASARSDWLRREVEASLVGPAPEASASVPSAPPGAAGRMGSVLKSDDLPVGITSNYSRDGYIRHVRQVLDMIADGRLEQVNLSQRFAASTAYSGPELYLRLRETNPAPFAAAFHAGEEWILSSSPERFVQVRGDRIEMRPIKGTRPRGADEAADEAFRRALLASEKDKWEHDLIVALTEAELDPLCVPGTVIVEEAKALEEYATVFHLVSTVAGRLRPETDRLACIRRLFPAGSITGRPKGRAMEVIDALEPSPRGVYTGAIGYIGVGGYIDLNVAIRTMVWREGRVHFHAGGAVVAGSSPREEFDETIDKAEGMVRALFAPGRP